jgi:hypothetical protein
MLFGDPITTVELAYNAHTGFSTDGVAYRYVNRPELTAARPSVIRRTGTA